MACMRMPIALPARLWQPVLALALHCQPNTPSATFPRTRGVVMSATQKSADEEGYGTDYHVPVMRAEAVEWLISDKSGTYVDGTLGGGGHSQALLDALAPHDGHVIGVDRDPDALAVAAERLAPYLSSGHCTLVRSNFGALKDALAEQRKAAGGAPFLDGILLDLGVSSHQIDDAARGFSYMQEGPLDMRMDKGGTTAQASQMASSFTAATIVNTWDADQIADCLWKYGDERESRRIGRKIVHAREEHGALETTAQLAAVLRSAGGKAREPKELMRRQARVFQALRIEVNQEMQELENVLHAAAEMIKPGGRLAIMSYHSLEDRRAKRLLRSGTFNDAGPPKDVYGNLLAPWRPLTRQAVVAGEAEVQRNSRARSARLRIGERTEHPAISPEVDTDVRGRGKRRR
jgi:16S rRNA (cytosine1402-N4)-methyltransferase